MLQERLLAEMKNHPNITSIVVAYSPATNAGKLYAPHFKRNGSEVIYDPLTYDYTKDGEQTAWYNDAFKKGSKEWISPYLGIADPQLSDKLFSSFLYCRIRESGAKLQEW